MTPVVTALVMLSPFAVALIMVAVQGHKRPEDFE